jgi:hypothetical protein
MSQYSININNFDTEMYSWVKANQDLTNQNIDLTQQISF